MSQRTQRFKVSDVVVVAAHSPLGPQGQRLKVARVESDPATKSTGAMGTSARYWLVPEGQDMQAKTLPLHELWDWMLEPAGVRRFDLEEVTRGHATYAKVTEDVLGDYVLFTDYAALEKRYNELKWRMDGLDK